MQAVEGLIRSRALLPVMDGRASTGPPDKRLIWEAHFKPLLIDRQGLRESDLEKSHAHGKVCAMAYACIFMQTGYSDVMLALFLCHGLNPAPTLVVANRQFLWYPKGSSRKYYDRDHKGNPACR